MCGIAGFIDFRRFDLAEHTATAAKMGAAIAHRGPDSSDVWTDESSKVCFIHRRLAIIDLSEAGHQPMSSASGRYVLVFNGEIYNHTQLRAELDKCELAPAWRGHSDTETLLASIDAYGLESTLKKLVGMFSLALYDQKTQQVYLARDRMGEKPLYYGQQGPLFFFASELKAIKAHPEFVATVDRSSLCSYLRHNYIPAPHSIYQGIRKLPPGCFVRLGEGEVPKSYWSFDDAVTSGMANRFEGDDEAVLDQLDVLLKFAVGQQMQSDVPLGAFLSGGVDSSLIVALMQEQLVNKVRTFSIGFEEKQFDEAPFARAVAGHIGTDHTELYVTGNQALDVIPSLPYLYDEPFSDSSQIPTYLVSKMAKEHVTVSLSGDAGDELFGGYNRYNWGQSIWNKLKPVPQPLRAALGSLVTTIPPKAMNAVLHPILSVLPQKFRQGNMGDKIHKAASVLGVSNPMELYLQLISHWTSPSDMVIGGVEPNTVLRHVATPPSNLNFEQAMMWLDSFTYLPDDILVKVDRAAMGVSLETRVPFLDHRVVEAAWRLPTEMRIRNGEGKWALRQLLYKRVPRTLIERPKTGFGIPLDGWLRGPLRDWAEGLLDETRLKNAGYFKVSPIRKKWQEHLSGRCNWHYHLWDILMFEAWREASGID